MNEMIPSASNDSIRRRICGEYLEMPGLRLTCAQAERLWGLDHQTCRAILDTLIGDGFLQQRPDGRYSRITDGAFVFPPARMAKVTGIAASWRLSSNG